MSMTVMRTDRVNETSTTIREAADSVGVTLRDIREERHLSLESAAMKTKIPLWYLAALESGDHGTVNDDVYGRIWFKAYCAYLGLDSGRAYAAYRNERQRYATHLRKNEAARHPKTAVSAKQVLDMPKMLRTAALVAVVLGVAVYFAGSVKRIVAAPAITLSSPQEGLVTTQRALSVEGSTEREVMLTVNGKRVATDDDGNFADLVTLREGLNQIVVTGVKKHSKEMSVTRNVIVEPVERPTALGL